ncbi:MAG: prepilin peptidase [Planctomycetes bacterium]|nr:prepilin peptidase [Planctomycetota bacterium]
MEWWTYTPVALWCLWVFLLGLMVGSFLNVLIARLPLEKSIIWPSSRCFSCYQPIRLRDNIPIIGYLRLRGKCRNCGATFSARYLWIEVGTGVAFLALFALEVLANWQSIPAMKFDVLSAPSAIPPKQCIFLFCYHAFLLSCLIAAAAIDVEHRIIPPMIPYVGLVVGIVGGALMPWPWPNPTAMGIVNAPELPPGSPWSLSEFWGKIPVGVQMWPFYGPTFEFAPPGTIRLGLLNGIIGALAGSLVVRLVKGLFELGFGREAMGLGDADLLMMAGAFLGWQIAVLSLFLGAGAALVLKILTTIFMRSPAEPTTSPVGGEPMNRRELPFGPGLALGVVLTWFGWPWIGPGTQYIFFDGTIVALCVIVMCVVILAAGLLLRRSDTPEPAPAVKA